MKEEEIQYFSEIIAEIISSKYFSSIPQRKPYYHMGATIIDSILQAGMNYQYVVYPRVNKLLQDFPNYKTTCDFLILMQVVPLLNLINWKNESKLSLIKQLAWFFHDNKIENEDVLSEWLEDEVNINYLFEFKGIGFKTVDYLKMLSGNQAIPIDRHLLNFLKEAGITVKSYQEASQIYNKTADILKLSKYELDKKIWLYMSKKNKSMSLSLF